MTIPTSVLSATFYSHDGNPLQGVTITAQLSGTDVYNDQYVANKFFSATTDASGHASLTLYTNSLGLRGTYYNVKAIYQGRVLSDSNVTLSGNADLVDVEGNYDGAVLNPPPGNYSITGNLTVTGTLAAGATTLASLTLASALPVSQGGTGATTPYAARQNLEIGTLAQQNADNVSITGGLIGGTTVVAVAGATTASGVTNVPAGSIAATDVQAAINELDSEKVAVSSVGSLAYESSTTVVLGGTGITSYAVGDLLYASGTTTLSKLPKGTTGQFLRMNAGETAPEWTTLAAGSGDVVGPSSATSGNVVLFDGATGKLIKDSTPGTDYAKPNVASSWTANQTFDTTKARIKGSSTGVTSIASANASASDYSFTLPASDTNALISAYSHTISGPTAARTYTLPDENMSVGYKSVPQSGSDKTTSYQLATTDVGKFIGVGASGSITIPDATFAAGDVVSIFNNTSAGITITCTITTAYIAGTDTDKASVTLATRGIATVLFLSGTVCVISGNVS